MTTAPPTAPIADDQPLRLVSIILPTCERNGLALECVASILLNSYQSFEILVIDQDPGRSLERDLAIRFPGEQRIQYHFLETRALDAARNLGVDRARGGILVFADDDVEVDREWLRAYVDAFAECTPPPGVVGGRIDPRWPSGRPQWLPSEMEYLLGLYAESYTLGPMRPRDLPIGANFAALKEHCERPRAFDDRLDYSHARGRGLLSGGDSLFSVRMRQRGLGVYYQPAARVWHKISPNKLTFRYFIRRSFWEGVTSVTVPFVAAEIGPSHWAGIARWQLREIIGRPWAAISQTLRGQRAGSVRSLVPWILFGWAYNAGAIRAALTLKRRQSLP